VSVARKDEKKKKKKKFSLSVSLPVFKPSSQLMQTLTPSLFGQHEAVSQSPSILHVSASPHRRPVTLAQE
jgi:hypothetical protein